MNRLRVVVTLGGLAHRAYLSILKDAGKIKTLAKYPFGHGQVYYIAAGLPPILCCYHPSQQNTQTGRLTADMLHQIFQSARDLANRQHAK